MSNVIVGTPVESPDCPDAQGIVVERRDSDDAVILKVNWVSLMGTRFSRWHFENALTQFDTGRTGQNPIYGRTDTAA